MKSTLIEDVSIFIITYNRPQQLRETLSRLLGSPFAHCSITVLDNCSTDEACAAVQQEFLEPTLTFHRNITNIGASANALQAFLMSRTPYTWVLCDDDLFDFSDVGDVEKILQDGAATLVMVGGHREDVRAGAGVTASPKQLMKLPVAVNYYRDLSFLPSTIYRTDFARAHIAAGYDYCRFNYPHMALGLAAVSTEAPVYVSRHRLVTASIGTQSYTRSAQLDWWYDLSLTVTDVEERRRVLTSQWRGPIDPSGLYGVLNTAIRLGRPGLALKIAALFRLRTLRSIGSMLRWRSARLLGTSRRDPQSCPPRKAS